MFRFQNLAGAGLLAMTLAFTSACSYYQVQDPASGKTYYTQDYKELDGGAVRFTSLRTGESVVLQNSAIQKVSENEAKYGGESDKAANDSGATDTATAAGSAKVDNTGAAMPADAPAAK